MFRAAPARNPPPHRITGPFGRSQTHPGDLQEPSHARAHPSARLEPMATAPPEPLAPRLAAIRDQLKLLADYL